MEGKQRMRKKLTEEEVKNKLQINDWRGLSKEEVIQLMQIAPEIDKDVVLKILDQVPHFVEETKIIVNAFKESIEASKSMSDSTKQYYTEISKKALDLLDSENISEELKLELLDLVSKIAEKIEKLDSKDREFMNMHLNKLWEYAGKGILFFAAIFGVKTFFTFLNDNDFI